MSHALQDSAHAGCFRIHHEQAERARQAAHNCHATYWQIDCQAINSGRELLSQIGRSLKFPDWYGETWDGLADCLGDLSWCEADCYVLLFKNLHKLAAQDAEAFAELCDILHGCSGLWQDDQVAFWALLEGDFPDLAALPRDVV